MNKYTRYYIGVIFERNGEYEYETHIKFKAVFLDHVDIDMREARTQELLDDIAKSWYGEPDEAQDKNSAGYYFNCGDVYVEAKMPYEVSKEVFDALHSIVEM